MDLGRNPEYHPHTKTRARTRIQTPHLLFLFVFYSHPAFVYVVMYIAYIFFVKVLEWPVSVLIGRSGWWVNALQIMSDCVQKPNQPSLWTSPLLARIHALPLISKPGAWRQTSEREAVTEKKNNTGHFYDSCKLNAEHCFHLCGFFLRVHFTCVFFCRGSDTRVASGLQRTQISILTREEPNRALDFFFFFRLSFPFRCFANAEHSRRGMTGIWHLNRWSLSLLSDKNLSLP